MIREAVEPLVSLPSLSMVWHAQQKGIYQFPDAVGARLSDFAALADRKIACWCEVAAGGEEMDLLHGKRLYLDFVDALFGFTVFTMSAWTCMEGYRTMCGRIREHIGIDPLQTSFEVKSRVGILDDLRTFRNKVVVHIAKFEGRPEDSPATREAYLNWSWGVGGGLQATTIMAGHLSFLAPDGFQDMSQQVHLPPLPALQKLVAAEFEEVVAELESGFQDLIPRLPYSVNGIEWKVTRAQQ